MKIRPLSCSEVSDLIVSIPTGILVRFQSPLPGNTVYTINPRSLGIPPVTSINTIYVYTYILLLYRTEIIVVWCTFRRLVIVCSTCGATAAEDMKKKIYTYLWANKSWGCRQVGDFSLVAARRLVYYEWMLVNVCRRVVREWLRFKYDANETR